MKLIRLGIVTALVVGLSAIAAGVAAEDGATYSPYAVDRQAAQARARARGPQRQGATPTHSYKAGCYTKSYTDPAGDVTIQDVTGYSLSLGCPSEGQWVFKYTTAGPLTSYFSGLVSIDSDSSPSTGCGGFEHLIIGSLDGTDVFSVILHTPTCNGNTWTEDAAAPAVVKVGTNEMTISFNEAAIGAVRQLVWHSSLASEDDTDDLPNGYQVNTENVTGVTPGSTTSSTASTTSTTLPPVATVRRLSGADRFETAIAISQQAHEPDNAFGVVLVRADSFADALAGSVLSAEMGAPVLLTSRDTLDPRTETEITRATAPGDTVWIIGGTSAISNAVADRLAAKGMGVQRLSGADRYETAVAVAQSMPHLTKIFLADGQTFPDALVASASAPKAGAALLLTAGSTMPAATKAFIDARPSAARTTIGSAARGADPAATTTIAGSNPADTSRLVAQQYYPSTAGAVGVATFASFPDGLAGAAHAAFYGGPLLLTTPTALSPELSDYIRTVGKSSGQVFIYGGAAAVSEEVRNSIAALIA